LNAKPRTQIPTLLKAILIQDTQVRVGAREAFANQPMKLALLANCDRYEVD
jgi:hypothetical protein